MSTHARQVSRAGQDTSTAPSMLARANALQSGPQAALPRVAAAPVPGALQRDADPASTSASGAPQATAGGAASAPAAAAAPCIEPIVGEDPSTLTEAGAVTVVEFGAEWCNPCKMTQAALEMLCKQWATKPPKAPVRIFTIDIDEPGNEELKKKYTDGSVPHIYFYVGSKEKSHYNTGLDIDVLESFINDYADEASQSGAWKGAKKGMGWGALAGGLAGIAGAIAIGAESGLEGNELIGAIMGTIAGGAAAGVLLGGGIGALAGWAGEEKKGSRRKKKKQPKSRTEGPRDRDELQADAMAARVLQRSSGFGAGSAVSGGASGGAAMDASLRLDMESHFGRDFSHVRLHRGDSGSRVADSMQAYAVTEGSDIYFARDGFAPQTPGGRAILAHELTHVAQQDVSGPIAPAATLESEASHASADVARGHQVGVRQAAGGDAPPLPLTRAEKTTAWSFGGAAIGAAVGIGIGLIAASQMKGQPYGEAAGWGALIGGGAGLIAGFFGGFFSRRTSRVGAAEADALIRRRYGQYMRQGVPAPLRNALIRPVTKEQLLERFACRHQSSGNDTMIGWTDTGVPWKGGQPPATTITSASAQPTCNGEQMAHATPERPVIYFQRDTPDAGIIVHEGLHAISDPEFQRLHNYVNEGATEMYTRRLLSDVNIAVYGSGYDDNVRDVERFERAVGEEPLARAYFGGDVPGLDRVMTPVYGPCSMLRWAFAQQANSGGSSVAENVLQNRGVDYCADVAALAPAATPPGASTTPGATPGTTPKATPQGTPPPPDTPATPPPSPSTPATGGSGGPQHP